jgi:hypothetical protein
LTGGLHPTKVVSREIPYGEEVNRMAKDDMFSGYEAREEEVETLKRRDVARHVRYLKSRFLSPDGSWNYRKQLTLPVDRGPWITTKDGKRRGQNEYEFEMDFKEAAHDLKLGIKFGDVVYPPRERDESGEPIGDPIAELRFKIEPQREFTEEAVNLRVLAQSVRLATHWAEKESTPDVDIKRKESKERLDAAVAEARRLNTPKTRDALQKYNIPVVAPTKAQGADKK